MAIRVPGIIVRVVNDTGIVAPPTYERYPVYIGEGDPYREITNKKLTRGAGDSDDLGSVTTVHEVVSVGDLPGISKYVSGTDYSLVSNNIDWAGAADSPTVGEDYYVTYTETRPASAYTPMLYFDENLIYADHGNKIRTNGNLNDVSVAGWLGLNAGAAGVIIAQLDLSSAADPDSPTLSELETAFIEMRDALNKITDYKLYLVPLSSGTLNSVTAANIFFNHAVLASQPENKQERTCVAALPMGQNVVETATFAQTYAHERMIVPSVPDTTCQVLGYDGDYDMRFYNASIVGKFCSVPIGINISDEIIPNILFEDNYTPSEANYLVARGVSPAKIKGEVVRNIMFITTDTTSALTEDAGVQEVKDYVKKYWREGLWNLYRNKPITDILLANIRTSSVSMLEYLISQTIIAEYKSLAVTQDTTEPRKVNVSGKIKPAYGLQWMDVTFTFVLSF
jgi:hypothetical protein